MKKTVFGLALAVLLLGSCAAPNVAYFYDFENGAVQPTGERLEIRLKPQDKISIVVNSRDPQLSTMFNLPIYSLRLGGTSTASTSQYISSYTINSEGSIDFPVLGQIKIEGMCREDVAKTIKEMLLERSYLKDAVVTVEYANLGFNVLGEVNRPGRYTFDRDCLTLLDAISMAGDLGIQGKRADILVIRQQDDGSRITYRLDLQNGDELLKSPAFYIQQNDVIYVEPNAYRSRQTTVNGNNILSASFWISVTSLVASIVNMII